MKSSNKQQTEYVSCIKIDGVPIPPPILTEEKRQQCRIWRKEAMLVEKELALRKKEKELEKLKASYEMSISSHSRQSSSGDSGACSLPVIDLLRDAVNHHSTKDFNLLLQEISHELKKFLSESVTELPDAGEFRFLLSELKKELLKKHQLLASPQRHRSIIKNTDSTYNDVAHLTLNHRSDTPSSSDTIREISHFPLDRKSDTSSGKTYNDISLHSESTFKLLDDCTPDDDSLSLANSLPADGSRCSFYDQALITSSPRCADALSDMTDFKPHVENDEKSDCCNTDFCTPSKAIRKNSYTLASPSPSVLAYLRNLALESTKEKSLNLTGGNQLEEVTSAKSVVRNLNNIWDQESVSKKYMDDISPGFRDSLEDIDDDRLLDDKNRNLKCPEEYVNGNEIRTSYHEHQLAQSFHENDKIVKQMKAAIVIQSYARGFFVRRLMRTYKVEQLKNTIKDAVVCAWELYGEQAVTPSDLHLHERIIQQVTAACYELHSIFFKWSTSEKMTLIRTDRERLKHPKPTFRATRVKRVSETESISASSSRSASHTRSHNSAPTHKRTKSNEVELKRPSTLPSIPKSATLNYKPWRWLWEELIFYGPVVD